MYQSPWYEPETQTIFNYLELMKATFVASYIYEEERQVGVILTHISTAYFDFLVAL